MKWLIGAFFLILLAALALRYMYGTPISKALRSHLKPGMTTNEVATVLGPPATTLSGSWVYGRPLMYHLVIVYFDDADRFTADVEE